MWLWFSFFTILWGAINGAWFGFEVLRAKSPFKLFIVQWFTSNDNIMFFSFVVGLIHLSIGHLWVFVRKIRAKSLSAIAQLGSLAMLTGFFFLVMLLILGWKSIPTWTTPAIIGGLFVIIMFGQQKRGQSFFKGIAAGFTNAFPTVLGSIGNFSDIISYIRLYAVSLAGASIAIAFNDIAMSIPSPVNIIATPLVVIGAHTMNISLGILSVVVHALRLNSLEFSSHLGLEWSGFQYKPFTAKNNIGRGEL
jgi:V/A-type H+-transporting ATPase subunit I